MEMERCFECDSDDDIYYHHVVPRSLGGKKTIPLCGKCHSLVHSKDLTSIKTLTKKALQKRKEDGLRVSSFPPFGYEFTKDNRVIENKEEQEAIKKIVALREQGYKYNKIATLLNRHDKFCNVCRGKKWYGKTIKSIYSPYEGVTE